MTEQAAGDDEAGAGAGRAPAVILRSQDEQRALLRAAIESLDEAFLLCDADDRIVLFNRRFNELAAGVAAEGIRFEEMLRRGLAAGVVPDARGREEEWLASRMAARRDGREFERQLGERWFLMRDRRGADGTTITVGTDITARMQAERSLQVSEARFRATFEQASVGMGVRTIAGRWLQVNPKLCAILGYSAEELLAITSVQLTPPEDRAHAVAYNERLQRGEIDVYTREKRYLHKDGHAVWAEVTLTLVRDPQGRPDYIISVIVDIDERKAAQDRARAAEERLRAGLEHLGEMVVLTDADDRIVIANQRFLEFNAPVAEYAAPGRHYSDHLRAGIALGLFPDADGREEEWLEERMALRRSPRGPVERRRQDGRWLMVDDQRLPDGGIVSFGIEITGRKIAEAAVAEAHERLRLALECSRTALWDHQLDTGRIYFSAEWSGLLGGEPVARSSDRDEMGLLAHPDELPAVQQAFRDALSGATPEFLLEHRLRRAGGGWVWMLSRGRVSRRDAGGRALRMIGTSIDITERKAAEEALAASEARLRSLVSLSNDVFWETDAQHRFTSQTYSRVSATRPPPATEAGMTRWEVPHLSPDEEGWRRHRADLDARRPFRDFELSRPTADGGVRYVQVSGEPMFDGDGNFTGYRGVGKDVTERRRAEEALRGLNIDLERRVRERTAALETAYRELEAFSYSVSHDLRAPLRAIAGFSNILREDEGRSLSEDGRRMLAAIDESAQRMGNLTDALLALARTSRQKLDYKTVDVAALVNGVAAELAPEYPKAWIEINRLPPIEGDPTLLRQVFTNLIGNALKYSANVVLPRVEVGAEHHVKHHVYYVRDNGVGFDMAYADRLFKPFERLHAEQGFKGAGIGLALTYLIVQRHGGRIWAEGNPGGGAVFRFTLGGVAGVRAAAPPEDVDRPQP